MSRIFFIFYFDLYNKVYLEMLVRITMKISIIQLTYLLLRLIRIIKKMFSLPFFQANNCFSKATH